MYKELYVKPLTFGNGSKSVPCFENNGGPQGSDMHRGGRNLQTLVPLWSGVKTMYTHWLWLAHRLE